MIRFLKLLRSQKLGGCKILETSIIKEEIYVKQ